MTGRGAKYFHHFEQLLVLNDCEKNPGFIVGNAMTTADITLWKLVGTLSQDLRCCFGTVKLQNDIHI